MKCDVDLEEPGGFPSLRSRCSLALGASLNVSAVRSSRPRKHWQESAALKAGARQQTLNSIHVVLWTRGGSDPRRGF